MPNYVKPSSDAARLALLRQSIKTGLHDQEAGIRYLSQRTIEKLQSFVDSYALLNQQVIEAESTQRQAAVDLNQLISQLEIQVQSLRRVIRQQVRRKQVSAAILAFYGIPASNPLPRPRVDWLALAQRLLAGDDEAQAAGYAAVSNRPQLAALVAQAEEALSLLKQAEARLHAIRSARTTSRSEAERLCRRIVSELRHTLREMPPAVRRQIMRSYGLYFRPRPGEAAEEVSILPPYPVVNMADLPLPLL